MAKTITWREATVDDIGRLARFRDSPDIRWTYGMLTEFDALECVFACVTNEYDMEVAFCFCEVQEVE